MPDYKTKAPLRIRVWAFWHCLRTGHSDFVWTSTYEACCLPCGHTRRKFY